MKEVTSALVKELREKTGAGMMDCKRALVETGGDIEKATDWLRQKGLATAGKKAGRSATEGAVGSYIHLGGKIGVLVEVNCETDFTAKNDKFQALVKDIAMQIAWTKAPYLRRADVPRGGSGTRRRGPDANCSKRASPKRCWGRAAPRSWRTSTRET